MGDAERAFDRGILTGAIVTIVFILILLATL